MANVIIGIHGLDNKPPKEELEHWWKLAMLEGLKKNNFNTKLPTFELVYWADILYDKPLDKNEMDEDSPYYLEGKYAQSPENIEVEEHSTRKKIVDFINRQLNEIFLNDDLSLNYSFITDTIVGKFFKDLDIYFTEECSLENAENCKAKELINQRLVDVLNKYKKHNILLISHSMGSIIAYDVLNFVLPQFPIHTLATIGSPLGLPIVISKIAAEQKMTNPEINHMQTPNNVTNNWFNFSDIQDKVAFNYQLNDDFAANTLGVGPIDYLVTNDYVINEEKNPHKSYGYLRTPEFANMLNDFILSERLSIREKLVRKTTQVFDLIKTQIPFSKKKRNKSNNIHH